MHRYMNIHAYVEVQTCIYKLQHMSTAMVRVDV